MSEGSRTLNLPRLTHVGLESFSLYRLRPRVDVSVDPGVFCLAGANGLGKSSFIAALNFALTGGVAPPSSRLDQLSKYRRDACTYSDKYFTGRIDEVDRGAAQISLSFRVGDVSYEVTRAFFEPYALRALSIRSADGTELIDPSLDGEGLQASYEERICQDIGLETFSQYVFLQHFVLSFDERRHLLFWNTRASEIVLYLALGLDPTLAQKADELRKAASAAGSQARNAQYQATSARQEMRRVTAALEGRAIDDGLIARYDELLSQRDGANRERNRLAQDLEDARLEFAEVSAAQMRVRAAYEAEFAKRFARQRHHLHPLVTETLADHLCRVCGRKHESGPARIKDALEAGLCPLCGGDVSEPSSPAQGTEALERLDSELASATSRHNSCARRVARLEKELNTAQRSLTALQTGVRAIEDEHDLSEASASGQETAALREQLKHLQAAVDVALARKDEQLQRRSRALGELEPIQNALTSAWNSAEVEFVPRFRGLAEGFIGLPLQVQLDTGAGSFGSAHLALSVNSTHRRNSEQLSESQRFFLDIALRMSLAQHMTPQDGGACLFVDTPEGALDIAYEARAGDMFSDFVKNSDQVVMTANVNSSQLLKRMAKRCGRERMKLVRMTDWTSLSDVQIQEEELFTDAYEAIEAALDSSPRQILHGDSGQGLGRV